MRTRRQPFADADLYPTDLAAWRTLRGQLRVRQEARRAQRRFHQDPAAYLTALERPRPRVSRKKTAVEHARDHLAPGDACYYADECNLSWLPTRRAMWSPKGQQVMIATPAQPHRRYGIGAVNDRAGETVVQFERRKRRQEIAALLEALLAKHPTGTVYGAWDNASTHVDDEVEDVVRAGAGRLVRLYLPTYSPWPNPIEMLRRHFRREVTHCELFTTMAELLAAANDFFTRHNRVPAKILAVIGSKAAIVV